MNRVLVCGGRDVIDSGYVDRNLDALHAVRPFDVLISGGAHGADTAAEMWAKSRGVPTEIYEVTHQDWQTYGRGAGHRRNGIMLTKGRPVVVVAFPGGGGTRDMVRRAEAAGLPVVRIPHGHLATPIGAAPAPARVGL